MPAYENIYPYASNCISMGNRKGDDDERLMPCICFAQLRNRHHISVLDFAAIIWFRVGLGIVPSFGRG